MKTQKFEFRQFNIMPRQSGKTSNIVRGWKNQWEKRIPAIIITRNHHTAKELKRNVIVAADKGILNSIMSPEEFLRKCISEVKYVYCDDFLFWERGTQMSVSRRIKDLNCSWIVSTTTDQKYDEGVIERVTFIRHFQESGEDSTGAELAKELLIAKIGPAEYDYFQNILFTDPTAELLVHGIRDDLCETMSKEQYELQILGKVWKESL